MRVGEPCEKMPREGQDVLAAIAQRRHADVEHVQAVVEVQAKAAALDLLGQLLVCRGDDAHVDGQIARAPQPAERHLLEDAQQLRLRRHRHLADLVEEQRPAVGLLEQPALLRLRVGERAALVAEQLALQKILGDGRAVDLDERAVAPPRRAPRDQVRDQLLARAGLALDQDGRVGRLGDLVDHADHLLHRRRQTGNEVAHRGLRPRPQLADLRAQALGLQRLAHGDDEIGELQRLRQVVERAQLQRLHRAGDVGVRGRDHDQRIDAPLARLL